ncbi:hypothetical protein H5071_07485, partial [Shewanella sp. SR41-2]|nr:hypothetical protein [Shewanella sp. SR41-2]
MKLNKILLAIGMASSVAIVGCGDDTQYGKTPQPDPQPEVVTPPLQAFAPNGSLKVQIRRTQYGVPHITA